MIQPEIALLLSTYQRPTHLRWALESIALQDVAPQKMELVVTDDGSTDQTPQIVDEFARAVNFRVAFTTHPHTTFRLARCRNEGARASAAPYLLFLDGDCILPRDHVRVHLERRKRAVVMAGDCCRLEQDASARVSSQMIRRGEVASLAPPAELARLRKLDRNSRFYRFIRHPTKPKLIGNNVGIWRHDFERVNGYDENFEGWGCEDDDLRYRLRASGVHIESILRWTHTYHLWHPSDITAPAHWKGGANVDYLLRPGRLTRCRNGLHKRTLADLAVRIVGRCKQPQLVEELVQGRLRPTMADRPEVEILFLPGDGRFSGRAECNVLVALEPDAAGFDAAREAHLMIAPETTGDGRLQRQLSWERLEQALRAVA